MHIVTNTLTLLTFFRNNMERNATS